MGVNNKSLHAQLFLFLAKRHEVACAHLINVETVRSDDKVWDRFPEEVNGMHAVSAAPIQLQHVCNLLVPAEDAKIETSIALPVIPAVCKISEGAGPLTL